MTVIPLRADWPGLPAIHDETVHYPHGLVSEAHELRQQLRYLNSSDAGSLPTIKFTTADFATPAAKEKTYGHGYTAEALRRMHQDALGHAIPVYQAIAFNLGSAATRLDATADEYRRVGRTIEADLRRFAELLGQGPHDYGEVREWQPSSETERWVPTADTPGENTIPDIRPTDHVRSGGSWRAYGTLSIMATALPPESAQLYHPVELAAGLRRIQKAHAWNLHYDVSKAWRDVADALDALCEKIHSIATELSGFWSGPAAGRAQLAFRNIDGTARSLEVFARSMSVSSRESGAALEQVVAPIRIGRSAILHQMGRDAVVQDAFDRLTGRYREILLQPMRALSYDLPFGGILPIVDERPMRIPHPVRTTPPPPVTADLGSVVPPVIGGSPPITGDAVWSPGRPWPDPGTWPPPVIG
jgi:hypothetical protein